MIHHVYDLQLHSNHGKRMSPDRTREIKLTRDLYFYSGEIKHVNGSLLQEFLRKYSDSSVKENSIYQRFWFYIEYNRFWSSLVALKISYCYILTLYLHLYYIYSRYQYQSFEINIKDVYVRHVTCVFDISHVCVFTQKRTNTVDEI